MILTVSDFDTSCFSVMAAIRCSRTFVVLAFAMHMLCLAPQPTTGVRVLAVQTFAGRSHWNFLSAVIRALTDAGHSVTVSTPFTEGDRDNYTELDTSSRFPKRMDLGIMELIEVFGPVESTMRTGLQTNWDNCDIVFTEDRMERIMQRRGYDDHGRRSFDVVLVHTMGSECVTRVAAALNLPMIYVIASTMLTYMERKALGDLSNPAVVSHVMASHAIPETFAQRFSNAALTLYTTMYIHYLDSTHSVGSKYEFSPVQPSAVFLNTHYSVEPARPFPPNVIQVGGIHLKPAKKIPKVRIPRQPAYI